MLLDFKQTYHNDGYLCEDEIGIDIPTLTQLFACNKECHGFPKQGLHCFSLLLGRPNATSVLQHEPNTIDDVIHLTTNFGRHNHIVRVIVDLYPNSKVQNDLAEFSYSCHLWSALQLVSLALLLVLRTLQSRRPPQHQIQQRRPHI